MNIERYWCVFEDQNWCQNSGTVGVLKALSFKQACEKMQKYGGALDGLGDLYTNHAKKVELGKYFFLNLYRIVSENIGRIIRFGENYQVMISTVC